MKNEFKRADNQNETEIKRKWLVRLKSLGIVGFLFFLGKGLIWLYVFYIAGKSCNN